MHLSGEHQANLERLDSYYGECDTPQRVMSGRKYKECIAKERAGGESLFDLTSDFNKLLGGDNNQVVYQNNINSALMAGKLRGDQKNILLRLLIIRVALLRQIGYMM